MNRSASLAREQELGSQFRAIAELSGEVAWVLDCASGQFFYLSARVGDLLGYSQAEIQQQLDAADPASPLAALCAGLPERLRRFAGGDVTRLRLVRQFSLRCKDGRELPLEVVSSLMLDAGGAALTVVGLLRDVSARHQREAEQRRFASMLNHEFRTPLSTIDGAIQRLEAKGGQADDATRRRYRNIGEAVDRLIGMLDQYLSPDRLEAIGHSKPASAIAPRVLLEEAAALALAAGRQATVDAGPLPDSLRCAPDGLRLALKVLVENAIQYSPPDTVIAMVGRQAEGGGIELLVRDRGGGVPAADSDKIFDKFYRGSNAGGLPGSGLGLYMARSVIDVHGGSVTWSQPEECGAEFKIWLPAQKGWGKELHQKDSP
jgi:PAS domain S-box-containing protein